MPDPAVLVATVPIWLAVFDAILTRRRPSALVIGGLVAGTIGVVCLLLGPVGILASLATAVIAEARSATRLDGAIDDQYRAEMRAANVEAFRFVSARDAAGGVNVGVFAPRAFAARRPRLLQTWRSVATTGAVEFTRRDYFETGACRFEQHEFLVDGALPRPSVHAA